MLYIIRSEKKLRDKLTEMPNSEIVNDMHSKLSKLNKSPNLVHLKNQSVSSKSLNIYQIDYYTNLFIS